MSGDLTLAVALFLPVALIESAYFRDPEPGSIQANAREAPLMMLVPLWTLIAANIYFGINTDLTVGVASRAAGVLLGAGG